MKIGFIKNYTWTTIINLNLSGKNGCMGTLHAFSYLISLSNLSSVLQ